MLYIFWGLLNLLLFAGFLVIAFYGIKQIRIRFGVFVAFVFVCLFFSFMNKPPESDRSKKVMHSLRFNGSSTMQFEEEKSTWHIDDSLASQYELIGSKDVDIYKTILFTIGLNISYGKDVTSNVLVPVYARPNFEGFQSGTKWIPNTPSFQVDEKGQKIQYKIDGIIQWNLLNLTIFSEQKSFTGSFTIND